MTHRLEQCWHCWHGSSCTDFRSISPFFTLLRLKWTSVPCSEDSRHVIGTDICLGLFHMWRFLFLPRNLGWHWKILSICPEPLDIQSNSEPAARHLHVLGKWPWSICRSTSYSTCSKSHTRILCQNLCTFARHLLTYFRPRNLRQRDSWGHGAGEWDFQTAWFE